MRFAPTREVVPVLTRIDALKARLGPVLIALAVVGCRGAGGTRSTDVSPIRSFASVSDRPDQVARDRDAERARTLSSRVDAPAGPAMKAKPALTGRVIDTEGTPVANATVRVAFDGATGSREVSGTTDRSGAFRLTGLRPDQSYTLIAEFEDDEEILVGRAKITGATRSTEIEVADPHAMGRRPMRDNGPGLSFRDARPAPLPIDSSEAPPQGERPLTARAQSPAEPDQPRRTEWKAITADSLLQERTAASREEREPGFALTASRTTDEHDPNPLPPALDRVDVMDLDDSTRAVVDPPTNPDPSLPQPTASAIDPSGRVVALPDVTSPPANESSAEEVVPTIVEPIATAPAVIPEHEEPVTPVDPPPDENPSAPALETPAELPVDPFPAPAESPEAGESLTQPPLTWNELPPPGELLADQAAPALVAQPAATSGPLASVRRRLLGTDNGEGVVTSARFDPRRQQLSDFSLPDLKGRPFHRAAVDSDFLLLAFWGSWSESCVQAITHLNDLQQHFDPSRLQVVAIAYEKTDPSTRAKELDAISSRLGLNFPILLGPTDAPCPLQEALNIEFYPTYVLIDRYGRIQWRASGGTAETLTRLDRAVNAAVRRAAERQLADQSASTEAPPTVTR